MRDTQAIFKDYQRLQKESSKLLEENKAIK